MDPIDAAGTEPPTTTQPIDMSWLLEPPVSGTDAQKHESRQQHHGRFTPPGGVR